MTSCSLVSSSRIPKCASVSRTTTAPATMTGARSGCMPRRRRISSTGIAASSSTWAPTVAAESAELERRLAHASDRAEEVQRHLDRLSESVQRLSVLSWALGDARKSVLRLRGAYLRK